MIILPPNTSKVLNQEEQSSDLGFLDWMIFIGRNFAVLVVEKIITLYGLSCLHYQLSGTRTGTKH
jgi:hypothetical protein